MNNSRGDASLTALTPVLQNMSKLREIVLTGSNLSDLACFKLKVALGACYMEELSFCANELMLDCQSKRV